MMTYSLVSNFSALCCMASTLGPSEDQFFCTTYHHRNIDCSADVDFQTMELILLFTLFNALSCGMSHTVN